MGKQLSESIGVFLEIGKKKTFAGALDWPGWCRSGNDELSALQTLLEYGNRYRRVLEPAGIRFQPPIELSVFSVNEQLEGSSGTDFGAPGAIPASDSDPIDEAELEHLQTVLAACWPAFEKTCAAARGKALTKGPRGGGRELEEIIRHVLGANIAYLSKIGGKFKQANDETPKQALQRMQRVMLDFMGQSARGELPTHGPRGGVYWPPRYFARRVAWHMLDHLWEIEDRVV